MAESKAEIAQGSKTLDQDSYWAVISPALNPDCDGCMCPTEHDGDYGSAGHAGPCPPHTCEHATSSESGEQS